MTGEEFLSKQAGAYPLTTTLGKELWQANRLFFGREGTAGMGLTPWGYAGSGLFGSAAAIVNAVAANNAGK